MSMMKLALTASRDPAMVHEQRWMHRTVRYEEGRVGTVIDMSRDGTRLCIRRDTQRGRDNETPVVWKNSDEVELVDIKRQK